MQFSAKRSEILRGLGLAAGIADRKSTVPILANVVIRAKKGSVTVSATDLTTTVEATSPAEVKRDGGTTMDAKRLHDVIKSLPGDDVTVSVGSGWATIAAGRSEFKLPVIPETSYPALPVTDETGATEVDARVLGAMLARTLFAASADETRAHIAGVLLESSEDGAVMVATDGHRLAKATSALAVPPETHVLIPRHGAAEIKRLLEGAETCRLWITSGHIGLSVGVASLVVKLSDAQFPPYEQVIPKNLGRVVEVDSAALLGAVRRVATMADDKTSGIALSSEPGTLSVRAESPATGEARETIEVDGDAELSVGLCAKYVADALAPMLGSVRVECEGELDPVVLRPVEDSGYLAVVMPMRL
jgi:DNA polymerase-3 subunit beta